jgi:hypothetical protein
MALADAAGFASRPARQGSAQARPGLLAREALLQRKIILLNGYPLLPQPLLICASSTAHVTIGLRMVRTRTCGPILTLSPSRIKNLATSTTSPTVR